MKVGDFEIEIKRSARRKTITVNIERDGRINAVAPIECSDEVIHKELSAREYLISKHVAKKMAVNKAKINRNFVNGQSFLYMGESYNLEISDVAVKTLDIVDDKFVLKKDCLLKAEKIFIDFYKTHGLPYIKERVSHFSKMVGKKPTAIKVMELGSHWGSCSSKHYINFHWKCIMAKPMIIDYLIVHELVHLSYPQHSQRFWDTVFSIMPNYKECEQWLRDYGVTLSL